MPPCLSAISNPLIAIAIIAVLVAVANYYYRSIMAREKALAAVAAELGLRYIADVDMGRLNGRFDHIDLLQRGYGRCTSNHLIGEMDGHPLTVCDFEYETGIGQSTTVHEFGVVFLNVAMRMPEVIVRGEEPFDKLAAAVGFNDLNFESAEFSTSYHVSAANRKFAYDLIHARAIEHFLAHPDYSWEFENDTIAMYRAEPFEPKEIQAAIHIALAFVELIPEFVWEAYGTTAARKEFHA